MESTSTQQTLEILTTRYIELREQNKKTHLCGYWFRQRCLKTAEDCQFAHGIHELKRIPSDQLLAIRQELFNLKCKLKKLKFAVLFNWKTKKFEVHKMHHLKALRTYLQDNCPPSLSEIMEDFNIDGEDREEEDDEDGEDQDGEESKSGKPKIRRSIQNINFEESIVIGEVHSKYQMNKFDMNKVMDSDDEVNTVKRKPRTRAELAVIRPWQNEIMADFLKLLWKEADGTILQKSTILKKYNEAGVPLTWTRLCLTRTQYEKKAVIPPFSLNKKVTVVLPLLSNDHLVEEVERSVSEIIIRKIEREKELFKLPVRLADVQKEYQLNLKMNEPPLFIVTKQLDVDFDNFFYKILESRGNIRTAITSHLKDTYPDQEWSLRHIVGLDNQETFLFMPFSYEVLKARELIEDEFANKFSIKVLLEEGKFNDYMMSRYFQMVKNQDEYNKIVHALLQKYEYKILKIGSGNFLINEHKFLDQGEHLFTYEQAFCPLCLEEAPDQLVVEQMLADACELYKEIEFLTFYEDRRILIVNNYHSLKICFEDMMRQKSLGVDLEGRLRIGGSINLIQVGCEETIYIFDIYQIQKLNKDENLLSLTTNVLKCAFLSKTIRKVFFDCKRDLEALHYILGVGSQNVYDVQPMHMALTQLREFTKNKKLIELKHVVTPGLNDVLGKHEVTHGVNSLKTKFKKIFHDAKQVQKYFTQRPLDPEFASYSAQDVEDLSELCEILEAKIDTVLERKDSIAYREHLVQQMCQSYAFKACQKYQEVFNPPPQQLFDL